MVSARILLILVSVARNQDVGDYVRNCRFHLYSDDLQRYTVDECRDVNQLVASCQW
jgi:hypothetical protein